MMEDFNSQFHRDPNWQQDCVGPMNWWPIARMFGVIGAGLAIVAGCGWWAP